MRLLFGSCFTLLIAAALGLGATWFTLTRGVAFGALTIGAWKAWPKSGSADIDPYARAMVARTGELPTGMGDGIAFYARTDDVGNVFDGRCTFTVAPLARPGNWLPTGGIEQFVLVWRLYDTALGVATRTAKEGPMPAIERKGC